MQSQSLNNELVAMISLLGLTYLVFIIIVMHKVRPDYNPRSRYISEYAVGKYGKLAASSFVIYGLAILGLSPHNLTGLTERLLLGISIVWLMIIVNYITT